MVHRPYRDIVPQEEAAEIYDDWLEAVEERIERIRQYDDGREGINAVIAYSFTAGFAARDAIGVGILGGRSVLDIGCNAGFFSLEMKRRNAGNTPAGLDPAEAAVLSVLKERLQQAS